jgi:hypothetical protein
MATTLSSALPYLVERVPEPLAAKYPPKVAQYPDAG